MPKFSFQRTERQTFSMERQTEASYPARDLKPLLRILTWWQARFFLLCLRYGHSDKRYFVVGGGVDSLSLDGYTDNAECGLIYRFRYYLLVNRFCRSVRAWLSDRYRRTFLTFHFWPSCFWGVRTLGFSPSPVFFANLCFFLWEEDSWLIYDFFEKQIINITNSTIGYEKRQVVNNEWNEKS